MKIKSMDFLALAIAAYFGMGGIEHSWQMGITMATFPLVMYVFGAIR